MPEPPFVLRKTHFETFDLEVTKNGVSSMPTLSVSVTSGQDKMKLAALRVCSECLLVTSKTSVG